ncbi:MAG: FkbM family methyltransferase, partial [Acidobacteriota bacterium]|nr:FkbM family methyltransferase [Acidobacteriota bacterium]
PLGALQMTPYMIEFYDLYFRSFVTSSENGIRVLDFSKPGFHRYSATGVEFFFPSIPEEEFGSAYTRRYRPKPGERVFDLGANAGATAFFLSGMVGEAGRVFAFEPDDRNFDALLRNLEHHKLKNVVPIKKAVGGFTGRAEFHMDGTLASGLADLVAYPGAGSRCSVEMLTFEDACAHAGGAPDFVKMDVEGAEVSIVDSAAEFLRQHPVHFAIDSSHVVEGRLTHFELDRQFREIGYTVHSDSESGQMFTWAGPAASQS